MKGEEPAPTAAGTVSCHEAAERIFEWLDGELEPEAAGPVGEHLETCARCYPRLVFERAFLEAVARASESESVPKGLREKVLKSLESEGLRTPS